MPIPLLVDKSPQGVWDTLFGDAATTRQELGLVAGGAGDIWVEKAGDTMTGDLTLSEATPIIRFIETDAPVDSGQWEMQANSNIFAFFAINDAVSVFNSWLSCHRNGVTIDRIRFPNGPVLISNNLGVGPSTNIFGAMQHVVIITNGTPPAAPTANGVGLWSQDVASSAELRAGDEAGNVTTLTPHNYSLFPGGTPPVDEAYPWTMYHRNDLLGLEQMIHMSLLARTVEELWNHLNPAAQRQLIYERTFAPAPAEDYRQQRLDAERERIVRERIEHWDGDVEGFMAAVLSPDLKPTPAWLQDRGVKYH